MDLDTVVELSGKYKRRQKNYVTETDGEDLHF